MIEDERREDEDENGDDDRDVVADSSQLPVADLTIGGQAEWEIVDAPVEKTFDDWVAVLRGGEPAACEEAVEAISEMGADVLPQLQALLSDSNPDLVVDVKKAIKLIEDMSA